VPVDVVREDPDSPEQFLVVCYEVGIPVPEGINYILGRPEHIQVVDEDVLHPVNIVGDLPLCKILFNERFADCIPMNLDFPQVLEVPVVVLIDHPFEYQG
jgi:hypothetical protein